MCIRYEDIQVNEVVTRATPVHISNISLVVIFIEALQGFEIVFTRMYLDLLYPNKTVYPVTRNYSN